MNTSLAKTTDQIDTERDPEEIRQDISLHKAAISSTISRLDDRLHEAVDWRTHAAAHPFVAIGLAAGAGVLLSNIFKRQASPQDRIMEALADGAETIFDQAQSRFGTLLDSAAPKKNVVQGALITLAIKAITSYLSDKSSSNTSNSHIQTQL